MSKSKIRHLFDGTRPSLDGASEAQNLSREMILPAYKAAISPGPPPEQTAYPAHLAKNL